MGRSTWILIEKNILVLHYLKHIKERMMKYKNRMKQEQEKEAEKLKLEQEQEKNKYGGKVIPIEDNPNLNPEEEDKQDFNDIAMIEEGQQNLKPEDVIENPDGDATNNNYGNADGDDDSEIDLTAK